MLTVDSSETNAYFMNYQNVNHAGIAKINCSDGDMLEYYTQASFTIQDAIRSLRVSDSGNTVYMTGSLYNSTLGYSLCKWDPSTTNLECSGWGSSNDGMDLISNSDEWLYALAVTDSYVFRPSMINVTSSTVLWSKQISCSSNCPVAYEAFSDYDGTNIHSSFSFSTTNTYGLYLILDRATGNIVNSMKQIDDENDFDITSLYVDSNSIAWISLISSSFPSYSKLIKYDASSDSYTTYKQTGALFLYQYVDSTNDDYWYGVTITVNISESSISNMSQISTLSVEISTTGLTDANSSHTIIAGLLSPPSFTSYTLDTSVDNPVSDLTYNYSSDCDNSSSNETTENETTSTNETTSSETTRNETENNETTSNETSSNETEENEIIEDETVETLAVTTLVSSGAVASLTVLASFANTSPSSSGGGQSAWALINMYQLITLLPLLGTYLGNDFLFYITELEMFSFNFKCMKDITFPFVDSHFIDKLDYEQPDKLFADNNFDSGSAFYNHYGFAKTLLFIFFANLIFLAIKLITVLFKFNKKCLKKTLKWFSGLFYFSIYLRICIEAILFIFISFILELSQFDSFEGHKVSYIIT